jgi:soluble lytic murein transglycosylase-like protein
MLEGMQETLARIQSIEGRFGPLSPPPPAEKTAAGTFSDAFEAAEAKTGIDSRLLRAVAKAESNGNPRAVSPAGALGLMQLMPDTARGLGVEDPFDARQNVMGGAKYLKQLSGRFGDLPRTLAAYNAGPGAVERHGGIPPYRETRNYVEKVIGLYRESEP